ncbi:MAG: hypothetical protein V1871_08980 [Planctomycetota bacterium]
MNKETIKRLVVSLDDDMSTLSTANPSIYANIYADKYNAILHELKLLYKDDLFIQGLKELVTVNNDNSMELTRLFRNANISTKQLKAFLEGE